MLMLTFCILAIHPTISESQQRDLFRTITAICMVESSGGRDCRDGDNGMAVGPLQIHMVVLSDVNHHYGTTYKSADRRNFESSIGICLRYLLLWAPNGTPERWARIWNGGPKGDKKTSTIAYWNKVRRHLLP